MPKITIYKGREVVNISGLMGNTGKWALYACTLAIFASMIIITGLTVAHPGLFTITVLTSSPVGICGITIGLLVMGSSFGLLWIWMKGETVHRLEMKPIPSKEIT